MKLTSAFNQKILIAAMALLLALSAIVIPVRATTYMYDSSNRLISIDYGQGKIASFSSDNNGNITGRVYSSETITQIAAGSAHTLATYISGSFSQYVYRFKLSGLAIFPSLLSLDINLPVAGS